VPGIHEFSHKIDVDGRDKPGHDGLVFRRQHQFAFRTGRCRNFGKDCRKGTISSPGARVYEASMSKDVLSRLAAIIKSRRTARPEDSHTRRLLDEAPLKPAKKLGEEAVEVAIAALAQDKKALIGETADMLYHLLVLLESREVTLDEVFEELERRMALTAVGEKRQKTASR
jgi:phosphoribosyl-ATP pyrophosphohydrolase